MIWQCGGSRSGGGPGVEEVFVGNPARYIRGLGAGMTGCRSELELMGYQT